MWSIEPRPAILRDPLLAPGIRGMALSISDYNHTALGERIGWFDRTDPFTISLWLRPDTLYEEAMIFTHSEEWRLGLRGYTLQLENNRLVFRMAHSYPQNALEVTTNSTVPVREWTHVAVTYDGSSKAKGIKIYQNGEPATVEAQRDNLYKGILFTPDIHTYGFKGIEMGQRDKFTPFKQGRIDEFGVFDRALTSLEIRYLYEPQEVSRQFVAGADTPGDTLTNHLLKEYFLARHNPAITGP